MLPHKSRYWIFPKIEDEDEFISRLEEINMVYREANKPGATINVISSDEKTGIQALGHLHTLQAKPGRIERKDPEYVRNGTTSLIASLNVKTGQIQNYSLGGTRKEGDYYEHIKQVVETDPEGEHIIICDQLNIHKSPSLVKWIAMQIGFKGDLGKERKNGILFSMKTRMKFLEDKQHRIRFLYTPKHCSWMNQIENWFGKLQKQVINRGEFDSVTNLENKIANYISYYNDFKAKPCKWKFTGDKYRRLIVV